MTNETTLSPTAISNAPFPNLNAVHSKVNASLAKAQEVTDRDVLATGVKAGTPKFQKAREELILTRLDARPKKIPPPEEMPASGPGGHHAPGPAPAMARKSM